MRQKESKRERRVRNKFIKKCKKRRLKKVWMMVSAYDIAVQQLTMTG